MRNSRVLTGALGALLLLVWGRIGVQVADALGGENDELGHGDSEPPAPVITQPRFIFPERVRDPFTYAQQSQQVAPGRKRPKDRIESWLPPPLRLSGVVVGAKGSTAMIESEDGHIHFLKPGDTLQGARVIRVSPGLVLYTFREKKAEWSVDAR